LTYVPQATSLLLSYVSYIQIDVPVFIAGEEANSPRARTRRRRVSHGG
jgi:hypothetical protein